MSSIWAPLLVVIRPRAAARGALGIGWGQAVLAGMAGLLAIEVLLAMIYRGGVVLWAIRIAGNADEPLLVGSGYAAGILAGLAGIAALGLLASAWGAGDEPVARSMERSLRLTCFALPHLAGLLAMHWVLAKGLAAVSRDPSIIWPLTFYGTWLAILIWTVNVLRIVSLGRSTPRCRWPGTCRTCGYSLVGRPSGDACPECGTAYGDAVGGELRGPGWEHGTAAWGETAIHAVFTPSRFGRELLAYSATRRSGRFAIGSFAAAAVTGFFTIPLVITILTHGFLGDEAGWVWLVAGGTAALMATTLMLGGMLLFGTLSGAIQSMVYRRNLLPVAAQAADYLSAAIALAGLIYGVLLIVTANVFTESPVGAIIVVGTLPAAAIYIAILHWRTVAAARWNNG